MRLYRALLYLYPASFRNEYGDELARLFAQQVDNEGRLMAWLGALGDVPSNAMYAHWDILRQDLRYAIRAMRRAPGFVLTAILVVALGVGANTAAFTLADFVLIRPLPFAQPERLVKLWEQKPGYSKMEPSPANYRDWKALTHSFSGMGAYNTRSTNLVGAGVPRRLNTALVTYDLLPLLGVNALIGRTITPADSGANPVAVLSYAVWQSQFGGDDGVVGRKISLDGKPTIVVGVMPASFNFPTRETEIWMPLALDAQSFVDRDDGWLQVLARLRPGVDVAQASADVALVHAQLLQKYPKELEKTGVNVLRVREELSARAKLPVLALCGAALCILLLACANLASLLLARAVTREREIAVRAALGAGRERIVRQLVTESLVLALLGGLAGLLVARVAIPALTYLVPDSLPVAEQPRLDARILLFAALIVTVTGLAFSLLPAIRAGGWRAFAGLRSGTREGGGRRQRARGVLVAIEIAASVVLLISSGLFLRAMWRLEAVDPGFRADDVLVMRTSLPPSKYARTRHRADFYSRVLERVRALPGVSSAAYTSWAPMTFGGGIWPVGPIGVPAIRDDNSTASLRYVTPGCFAALGIPVERGRDVEDADDMSRALVAVVSESFARRYWPNKDPLGKRFGFVFKERTVVGVVGNVKVRGIDRESEPQVYLPQRQVEDSALLFYSPQDLIVRGSVPVASLVAPIRQIIGSIDPEQPISDVEPMTQIVADQTAPRVAQLRVLGVLAIIALVLAGVGIHGLLAFTVSSRSHEIGVRLALGARTVIITNSILREGLTLTLAGVIPGIAIAYASGRAMESLLVGVKPADGWTIGAAVALCTLTTIVGCVRPALRASRIDPMTALRSE